MKHKVVIKNDPNNSQRKLILFHDIKIGCIQKSVGSVWNAGGRHIHAPTLEEALTSLLPTGTEFELDFQD